MNRRNSIFIIILLIIAAIIIHFLAREDASPVQPELLQFLSGLMFGIGITFLLQQVLQKKERGSDNRK